MLTFAARRVVGDVEHDLVKLSTHGRSVSFLKYRDFEDVAHPELEHSVRVFLPKATYTEGHTILPEERKPDSPQI